MGTIGERVVANSSHPGRDGNRGQAMTTGEGIITNRGCLIKLDRSETKPHKNIAGNCRHAVRDGQGGNFGIIHIQVTTAYIVGIHIAIEG